MKESYLDLPAEEKTRLLTAAEARKLAPPYVLERDVIMVALTELIATSPTGLHATLTGGTGAAKAHRVLHRFSEDIDITYDIDAIETGASEAVFRHEWEVDERRDRLCKELGRQVASELYPYLKDKFALIGEISYPKFVPGAYVYQMLANYSPLSQHASNYPQGPIKLEIGCRNTGKPNKPFTLECDLASVYPDIIFPTANISVLALIATFWDKIHLCADTLYGDRHGQQRRSRHIYDLVMLYRHGVVAQALADPGFGRRWIGRMYQFDRQPNVPEGDVLNLPIRIAPHARAESLLRKDYEYMIESEMLYGDYPSFDEALAIIRIIEQQLNEVFRRGSHSGTLL